MTFDAETSEMTLKLLVFALDFARIEADVKKFYELNREVIERLAEHDKQTLREAYRAALQKVKGSK